MEIARRIAAVVDDLIPLETAQLRLREQLRKLRVGELVHRQAIGEATRDDHKIHRRGQGYAASRSRIQSAIAGRYLYGMLLQTWFPSG